MLEVGTLAPDFTLPDQDGTAHRLSDYRGKKVILYFYPRDNTPAAPSRLVATRLLCRSWPLKTPWCWGSARTA